MISYVSIYSYQIVWTMNHMFYCLVIIHLHHCFLQGHQCVELFKVSSGKMPPNGIVVAMPRRKDVSTSPEATCGLTGLRMREPKSSERRDVSLIYCACLGRTCWIFEAPILKHTQFRWFRWGEIGHAEMDLVVLFKSKIHKRQWQILFNTSHCTMRIHRVHLT